MINVKNMFSDKYQDDDLMQEICIAYEKIPEKIKIVLSDIDLPPSIEEKVKIENSRRGGYIKKSLISACSKYLLSKRCNSNLTIFSRVKKERLVQLKIKVRDEVATLDEVSEYQELLEESLNSNILTTDDADNNRDGIHYDNNIFFEMDNLKIIAKILNDSELDLLNDYYFNNMTDSEIGLKSGISRSAIGHKRKKLLNKLKESLLDMGYDFDDLI